MPIRFRKSIKILPGVRLNLSKSGMSVTLGGKMLSLNLGKQGTYANVDLPGTGLTYRTRLAGMKAGQKWLALGKGEITIGLNGDGTLSLTDKEGNALTEKDAAAFLKTNKSEVTTWLEEACGRINDELLTLINFHHTTPAPSSSSTPLSDDPTTTLTKHIRDLIWPRDTNVSFDIEDSTILLDVDLPEIEDMPSVQAVVNKKEMRLVFKDRAQSQRRQEYLTHIHAVAFRLLGEVFATLPTITAVSLSAYSQRPDPRTGQIRDDYLLSVRVTREQWEQINFANLPAIDVVTSFDLFTVRRKISKSGELATIEPFMN